MRTFIAIEVPSTIHSLIHAQQQALATLLAADQLAHAIQWTPSEKAHITLRFLGITTDQQRQAMQRALTDISATQKPFTLSVGGLGYFPNPQTPTVVWLSIQDTANALVPLQRQIEQAAQAAGYAAEVKPFTPHLTIGRLRRTITRPQSKAIARSLAQPRADDVPRRHVPPPFVVNHMVHMQSQLQSTGAIYTPLHSFTFAAV